MKNVNNDFRKETMIDGARVTRARAKALDGLRAIPPITKASFKSDSKDGGKEKIKRHPADAFASTSVSVAGTNPKRRAVLKDVTNVRCAEPVANCKKTTKPQGKPSKRVPISRHNRLNATTNKQEDTKKELHVEEGKENTQEIVCFKKEEGLITNTGSDDLTCKEFVDIDLNKKDLQLCSLYAPEIHKHMCIQELEHRPLTTYMESLQQEITSSMRGILIDWLVEVSEEYKLVPDTLYLTVNLLDRFLSFNQIGKQRLQLLGVTCMLISSKYEEICTPRVEEFCSITDNTYTKEEVLEMESHVLNFLKFRVSVATTKTFLRRFIYAAQTTSEAPSQELEFLANFLAELSLLEYDFLKFLPSIIAASAVFLARWTLNNAAHPWNPALEHYSSYTTSQLKPVVLALEELQRNTANSPLNAVREKYRQQKFKCVATLVSPQGVASIFFNGKQRRRERRILPYTQQ